MYATCLFCAGSLGKNDVIEHMGVGRRLAFDLRRGRLWTVCPTCRRWNLCPFDQRWEALEECERLAAGSLLVERTSEVSLLRHRSGVSLVRLGQAPLRELIPWRFARGLRKRRRDYLVGVGIVGVGGVTLIGGTLAGGGALVSLLSVIFHGGALWKEVHPAIRLDTGDGRLLKITRQGAKGMWIGSGDDGEPSVQVLTADNQHATLRGDPMKRLLMQGLPYANEGGAPLEVAAAAGARIAESGGVEGFLDRTFSDRAMLKNAVWRDRIGMISKLPHEVRIGLEAATHLEQEERALSGEMRSIIAEWREEEVIAEIADSLIEPPSWPAFKDRAAREEGEAG